MKLVLGTGVEFPLESSIREFNPRNTIENDRVTVIFSADATFDQAKKALVTNGALNGMYITNDEGTADKLDDYKLASLCFQQFEATPSDTRSLTAIFYKPTE